MQSTCWKLLAPVLTNYYQIVARESVGAVILLDGARTQQIGDLLSLGGIGAVVYNDRLLVVVIVGVAGFANSTLRVSFEAASFAQPWIPLPFFTAIFTPESEEEELELLEPLSPEPLPPVPAEDITAPVAESTTVSS